MKIALAQINPIIGDLENNLNKILENIVLAQKKGADLIVFPELAISGYPPKDLLLKKQFINDNKYFLDLLIKKSPNNIGIILGIVEENLGDGKPLFNSIAFIENNKLITTRQKTLLPTYDVFDEDRYFEAGKNHSSVKINNKNVGLSICEDIWHDDFSWARPRYKIDPISKLCESSIDLIINSSASPYFIGKPQLREKVLKNCAKKFKTPIIYVNQIGGNDELIFDGNSCVIDSHGEVAIKLKAFEEDLQVIDIENKQTYSLSSELNDNEEILQALVLGVKDYVRKCGFKKVIIGLSGGIDSALVTYIAVLALESENVLCVSMPSRFTSKESIKDAEDLAKNLKIELKTISIEEPFTAFLKTLEPIFNKKDSATKENLQARIRGNILMAISNELGGIVLTTGNKSELATGYCTLYGDMCGALAVIADLTKTMVYSLAKYINKKTSSNIIPENIINKAPSAELKLNQKDQDTLPPYDDLDTIINSYVEEHLPIKEILTKPLKTDSNWVCKMIDNSEYKRKQTSPVLKITNRSFGYGWRMPIAQKYKERTTN